MLEKASLGSRGERCWGCALELPGTRSSVHIWKDKRRKLEPHPKAVHGPRTHFTVQTPGLHKKA